MPVKHSNGFRRVSDINFKFIPRLAWMQTSELYSALFQGTYILKNVCTEYILQCFSRNNEEIAADKMDYISVPSESLSL